jgi:WD40 repeat protein
MGLSESHVVHVWGAGVARAISPDARCGHPALRSLGGNLASAILAALGFLRRSIGTGNPSRCAGRQSDMLIGAVLSATLLGMTSQAFAAPSYEQEVAPILRTYCAGCHNDRDAEAEFSVERFATLTRGGAGEGGAIAPGDPAGSMLIRRIESTDADHMPPLDQPQMPAAELATLKAWIAAGATPPASDTSILETLVVPKLPASSGPRPVTAAAVTADGSRLAVATGGDVSVFRLEAGRPVGKPLVSIFDGPAVVKALHFNRDGTRLVVAGGITGLRGVAEIRNAANGTLLMAFGGHRDLIYDAELSPDEATLATAGYDRSVKLWNVADGSLQRSIDVHNAAVFDLAWHPSGKVLASASADETVKLWRAGDGVRLDTLGQPQGEVACVAFTRDGSHVIAAGRDKRIHLWRLVSLDAPAINPPVQSRFAHDAPVVAMALSADGSRLITAAEDRSLSVWSVPALQLVGEYPRQPDLVSVAVPLVDGLVVGRMDGSLDTLTSVVLPAAETPAQELAAASPERMRQEMPDDERGRQTATPPAAVEEHESNDEPAIAQQIATSSVITGTIGRPGDVDCFQFPARQGEVIVLEVDAARSKSQLDSKLEVLDAAGQPVERVVLQAVRDSWFTFRGKNSTQADDFRLHNWDEMGLDEYVYAGGEVVRLWLYPRGPDSGFTVYPGEGTRHTFFGTSAVTHALGEPAWVVRPLTLGEEPEANGLPVFRLLYENDDESTARLGRDSLVVFTPPADGDYIVRIRDVRGFGAEGDPQAYRYRLTLRPPQARFTVAIEGKNPKLGPEGCRELTFRAERIDGFDGPIRIEVDGLPPGFTFHGPIEIEAGQRRARGVLSAAADVTDPDAAAEKQVRVRAMAEVAGREVVQELGTLGDITIGDPPKFTAAIVPATNSSVVERDGEPIEFTIRPGETITAKVRIDRRDFKERIEFGRDTAADRNLPHGVFVDNLGLSGLLIVEGENEREFFLTAAPKTHPGRRLIHLWTGADGGQATLPVWLNVVAGDTPASTNQ